MNFRQEFPGGVNSTDTLRIIIIAYEIKKQNLQPKNPNNLERSGPISQWNMIAPTDIQEALSHTWEEYHSFQGRAAQLRSDTMTSAAKAAQVQGGVTQESGNTDPAKLKVDAPMVWTGSERLQYSFTFTLMRFNNIKQDVMNPIHEFRKLSCASIDGQTLDTIQFPAIFSIESHPAPFINIDYCALTDVQTTYNAPYVGGLPQRAELTLTFKDIRPLYTQSWGPVGGILTTGMR